MYLIKRRTILLSVIICTTILTFCSELSAQKDKEKISIGEYRTLYSKILKEQRRIWVHLPASYHLGTRKYPVLYKCDALSVSGFAGRIKTLNSHSVKKSVPQMILVEIENTDRQRDMYPVKYRSIKPGAEKFLLFIEKELIPFINRNYKSSEYKILMGESNSALFTVYSFLAKPELFNAYIASSPAIGPCMPYLSEMAENSLKRRKYNKKHLYMIYGEKDHRNVVDFVPELTKSLKKEQPEGLRWHNEILPNEGHVPESGFKKALTWIFDGYRAPDNIINTGKTAIKKYYENYNKKMGFSFSPNSYSEYKFALSLMRSKKPKAALSILSNIIRNNPSTPHALSILMVKARIHNSLKQYEQVIEVYRKARLYSPSMAAFIDTKIDKLKNKLKESVK